MVVQPRAPEFCAAPSPCGASRPGISAAPSKSGAAVGVSERGRMARTAPCVGGPTLLEKVTAWTKVPVRIPARLPLAQHPRPSGVNISDLHPLSQILNMIFWRLQLQ